MSDEVSTIPAMGGRGKHVGDLAGDRIARLQRTVEADNTGAKATLAALRNALYESAGNRPQLWEVTSVPVEGDRCMSDAPTWEEVALHITLCLYARHQQSQSTPMHRQGIGLGEAVRRLELAAHPKGALGADDKDKESGARRYLNAAATSVSVSELTRHLAGLVSLMRQERIGMDYRMLAEDIYQFQTPGGPSRVRLRWARQHAKSIKQAD